VAEPTKKKHIGRKEKNTGFHHSTFPLLGAINNALRQMNAQKAAGVQCPNFCNVCFMVGLLFVWCGLLNWWRAHAA
jgi:hypothetical protein